MGLTPIILNGVPTCPDGYALDPTGTVCLPVTGPISITASGLSLPDVDPKNAAELAGLGTQNSGLPAVDAFAHWHAFRRITKPPLDPNFVKPPEGGGWWHDNIVYAVQEVVNLYDWLVSVGVAFMGDSATRNNPGFWKLVGSLISDLLGVEVDGGSLYQQLNTRGTLAAMQGVGASLVNLLIGEFTGTASGQGGNIAFSSSVNPGTNLPTATLTPAGGVLAAQALMGFVLSSAVRQGNLEAIGAELGVLGGHVEKFSEAMRTNLGIGRMLRFALRPIFQDLIALPLKWAINIQYLPTLLNMAEAVRGVNAGDVDEAAFSDLAARAGYNPDYARSLRNQHTLNPPVGELLTLRAAGRIADQDFDLWLRRHGFSSITGQLLAQASDLMPARRVSLALAEHYLLEFGRGTITAADFTGFIDQLKRAGYMLTTGEVSAIESVAAAIVITKKVRPRHLSIGQLTTAYIDGAIDLLTFQGHLADVGFSPEDVQIETEVLLIKAKAAADAAAAKAARLKAKASGGTPPPPPTVP
jgi:hypothetical protein